MLEFRGSNSTMNDELTAKPVKMDEAINYIETDNLTAFKAMDKNSLDFNKLLNKIIKTEKTSILRILVRDELSN